jgi:hypothetical protein
MSRLIMRILDSDGDIQQFSVPGAAVETQLDYSPTLYAANDLRDAILGVIIGANAGHAFLAEEVVLTPTRPSNNFAQTNVQWIARYTDNVTGSVRTLRIGTANLALATLEYNGAPALDLSTGAGAALKTAFEAYVLNDGNPVTLNAVYFRE